MKITHFTNAFHLIEAGQTRLVCDPWVGTANYGGWMSFPITEGGCELLNGLKPTCIYISHLHADHLDEPMLGAFENKDVKIVIKKFADGRMVRKLNRLGYGNILECEGWAPVIISDDLEVTVIPADPTTSEGYVSGIVYDLDTSLLVQSRRTGKIFYNHVDNIVCVENLGKIAKLAQDKYGRGIDVACLTAGAASEYPHCFLNIDREAEKARIVAGSLLTLREQLSALSPQAYFFAGGSYAIAGKFSMLNDMVAQPSIDQIGEVVRSLDIRHHRIQGGFTLDLADGSVSDSYSGHRFASPVETGKAYAERPYEYFGWQPKSDGLHGLFERARLRYFAELAKRGLTADWQVVFELYDDLRLTDDGVLAPGCVPREIIRLTDVDSEKASQVLTCHLDRDLFGRLLAGDCIWNISLSGSIIMFERQPNIFNPTITGSLNYLVDRS